MKQKTKTTHDYAIKATCRRKATLVCLAFAFLLSLAVDSVSPVLKQAGIEIMTRLNWDEWYVKALAQLVNYLLPVSEFGLVYLIYDKAVWKCSFCRKFHQIPNLNGTWEAEVVSPLKSEKSKITMTIKQDWNKLHVEGKSKNGTQTNSYTASIMNGCRDNDSSVVIFSYAYYITAYRLEKGAFGEERREVEQRYPGFNSLTYDAENDILEGDYFSGKDITLLNESDFMKSVNGISDNTELIKRLKGCGSKGRIRMKRTPKKQPNP